jgi:hypothetical protein
MAILGENPDIAGPSPLPASRSMENGAMRPVAVSSDHRMGIFDPGRPDKYLILVTLAPEPYVSPPIDPNAVGAQTMVRFEPWPEHLSPAPFLEVIRTGS